MRLLDLRTIAGATRAVVLLRSLMAVCALFVSAAYPLSVLEQQVPIAPSAAPPGVWFERLFVAPWIRYDVVIYKQIIEQGYRADNGSSAFHPLYPLAAWICTQIFQVSAPLAMVGISTLATVALCVLMARYVERVHGADLAQRAAWLMLLYPLSFVLLIPYTESTFMALAVATLWATRDERWWLAGVLGGLAVLTRQQGVALLPPLAWGLATAYRAGRTRWHNVLTLALIPGCYGLFVIYRSSVLGDMSMAGHESTPITQVYHILISPAAEHVVAGQRLAWPWEPLIDEIRLILASPNSYPMLIDVIFGGASLAVLLLGYRNLHAHERLYCFGIAALTLCYYNGVLSPYLSLPRHMLLAFPFFIVLATWLQRRFVLTAFLEAALPLYVCLTALFVRQGWVP